MKNLSLQTFWLYVSWIIKFKEGCQRGYSHMDMVYVCACLLGCFFAKFGIAIRGFPSEPKEPKFHKLGVFWANYHKKHPIWLKLGAFLSKMVYWWVGNYAKKYIEKVRFSRSARHIHVRFWWKLKYPLPPGRLLSLTEKWWPDEIVCNLANFILHLSFIICVPGNLFLFDEWGVKFCIWFIYFFCLNLAEFKLVWIMLV